MGLGLAKMPFWARAKLGRILRHIKDNDKLTWKQVGQIVDMSVPMINKTFMYDRREKYRKENGLPCETD